MVYESPLRRLQEQAEADFISYGPMPFESAPADGLTESTVLVATFGELEAEYAVLRRAAGLLDLPQRGTVVVKGSERLDFLNRMLTNDMLPLERRECVRAFLVNRQGRIQADLFCVPAGDAIFMDVDVYAAASATELLNAFLFSEDVTIENESTTLHRIALHGPDAGPILEQAVGSPTNITWSDLGERQSVLMEFKQDQLVVYRRDSTGERGFEIICPATAVVELHEQILEAGLPKGMRAIGWMAYNMARIEAGEPVFLTDFGPGTLPHETGAVLEEAVSFTKGCYPGQEVVARMQNLGHAKQLLKGTRIEGEEVPPTGAAVVEAGATGDGTPEVIGAITSATPAPMLGSTIVGFAMLRHANTEDGTEVLIEIGSKRVRGVVQPLRFLKQR